jgi:hypothetical protein
MSSATARTGMDLMDNTISLLPHYARQIIAQAGPGI